MLKHCVKHYYQWLHSTIHHKTEISQSSPDSLRKQGPSKYLALASCIQSLLPEEQYRKGGECKFLRFYSRLFLVPKPCQRWRPVIRPKQAEHLPTNTKVQNGNSRVLQGLSDSRGMGVIHCRVPTFLKSLEKIASFSRP